MSGILFDARWITKDMTGVGRVALETLRAIPPLSRSAIGAIVRTDCPVLSELEGFRLHRTTIALTAHPLTELYEQTVIPYLCHRFRYKAFVSFEGRLPLLHAGFRTYGYVHDATFISKWRHNGLKYSLLLWGHLVAMRAFATGIITVSHASKARLVELARIPPRKISVIHNADSGLDRVRPSAPPFRLNRPYILAVGMSNPRKGFPALLDAFRRFNRGRFDLIATGSPEALEKTHKAAGADPHVRLAGYVTENELRHLYEHATCLVYPSQEEGFGIPLLDAALLGLPVACSDLEVFREVLGDEATYFDQHDPESIAQALATAASPDAPRGDPQVLRGKFSWERSATALSNLVNGLPP